MEAYTPMEAYAEFTLQITLQLYPTGVYAESTLLDYAASTLPFYFLVILATLHLRCQDFVYFSVI
jgi:hypothetical protein